MMSGAGAKQMGEGVSSQKLAQDDKADGSLNAPAPFSLPDDNQNQSRNDHTHTHTNSESNGGAGGAGMDSGAKNKKRQSAAERMQQDED